MDLRDRIKEIIKNRFLTKEISTTGTGATFTPGTGEQYATPKAFRKKGTKPVIYYYKLGFKPVNKTKLRKAAKGIEVVDIYK
ncbi:hypothetical protein [Haliea sp.]|jgi:hypothetical protein|uniref:hypothetical protein n=1 Tax=Haliea sp. TaxID=1932666 RepID=UPI00257C6BF6|nr:hypothetical protein [Haliea sp.]|tara:strand:+ start:1684 stop:1929 length:246 start_codon:yes stop_codon:yes gene_type:complete